MKKVLSRSFKDMGKHIINGIKYVIPVIVIYSILLALINSDIIKSVNFDISSYVYLLIIPVLTAFIANSICDKLVFIPAFILGVFLEKWGLGFFGGIIGGLLIGYLARCISSKITIKNNSINLMVGYIVLGGISFIISYYMILYMAAPGILLILDTINDYILSIKTTEVILLVAILALLTALDLGGPFNKLAFSFILAFYLDGFYHITGPALVSVTIPPLSIYLGLLLMPNRFNGVDHKTKKIAIFGSLFGLTEGALQVAYRRPLKIIPILVFGSVLGSIFAAFYGLENELLVTSILGVFGVNNIIVYIGAHLLGVIIVIGLFYFVLPKEDQRAVE